jgi:hypothetical protein
MKRMALAAALAGALVAFPAGADVNAAAEQETVTVWKVDYSGRPPYDRERVEVPVADIASFETAPAVETERVWHTDFSGRPPFKRGYADLPVIDAAQFEIDSTQSSGDVKPKPFSKPRHR